MLYCFVGCITRVKLSQQIEPTNKLIITRSKHRTAPLHAGLTAPSVLTLLTSRVVIRSSRSIWQSSSWRKPWSSTQVSSFNGSPGPAHIRMHGFLRLACTPQNIMQCYVKLLPSSAQALLCRKTMPAALRPLDACSQASWTYSWAACYQTMWIKAFARCCLQSALLP